MSGSLSIQFMSVISWTSHDQTGKQISLHPLVRERVNVNGSTNWRQYTF